MKRQTNDNRLAQSAMERLIALEPLSAKVAITASSLITVALYLLNLMVSIPSEMTDDYGISIILSSVVPDANISLFVNAALCQAISATSNALPASWNCFILFEIAVSALATWFLFYTALRTLPPIRATLVIATFMLLSVPYCTCWNNFTVVAATCTCAGGFGLLARLRDSERPTLSTIVSVLLLVTGFAIRANAVLLGLPFFILTTIYTFWEHREKLIARMAIPFTIVLFCCGALTAYDANVWSQPENDAWKTYNRARSLCEDYPMIQNYDRISNRLAEIGVTETDYYLAIHWMTNDTNFFTANLLQEIHETGARLKNHSAITVARSALRFTSDHIIADPFILMTILVALLLLIPSWKTYRRREWVAFALLVIALFACGTYFMEIGKLPERVNYPLWFYFLASLALIYPIASESSAVSKPSAISKRSYLAPAAGCFALLLAFGVAVGRFVPNYDPQALLALTRERPPQTHAIEEYVRLHPNDIFLMKNDTRNEMRAPYLMKTLPDADLQTRIVSVGGWSASAPHALASYKRLDLANPLRDIAVNNHAYFIAPVGSTVPDRLLTHLREHYFPDASYATIDTIHNDDSHEYSVIKYQIS